MRAATIRKLIGRVRRWPVHPQWLLAVSGEDRDLAAMLGELDGDVLDIGCAGKHLAAQLPERCTYTGLDYPDTAVSMYRTRPDVFADARALPFADASFRGIILKDVLEHVRGPDAALAEISRVLADGGKLILWIPFIYPIHDAPHDFQRLTEHGLHGYLAGHGLAVLQLIPVLTPIETASLMTSLAFADAAEQILTRRRWLLPIVPVLALFVLLSNLAGKALSGLPATRFMPAFYRVLASRAPRNESRVSA